MSIPSTLDSVEFFLYDTSGKEEYAEIVQTHVSVFKKIEYGLNESWEMFWCLYNYKSKEIIFLFESIFKINF